MTRYWAVINTGLFYCGVIKTWECAWNRKLLKSWKEEMNFFILGKFKNKNWKIICSTYNFLIFLRKIWKLGENLTIIMINWRNIYWKSLEKFQAILKKYKTIW